MLRVDAFMVGDLVDFDETEEFAPTLLLPRDEYEHTAILARQGATNYGVILGERGRGMAYPLKDGNSWSGVVVPNISFEVDWSSIYDPNVGTKVGSLLRDGGQLSIVALGGPNPRLVRWLKMVVQSGLPDSERQESAGFTTWRITIGEGTEKTTLFEASGDDFAEANGR